MGTTIGATDIAYNLFCRYERRMEVTSYPGLLALYALAQLGAETRDRVIMDKARNMLLRYPDDVSHPHYNFESYRVGGNGRAYLVMRGQDPEGARLLREYADITLRAPTDAAGIQCMPSAAGQEYAPVWIDVVTATTPFMVMAGLALGEREYVEYGAKQCFMMYDLLEDPDTRLLHQARGFMQDPREISRDHWSRGNGWGLVGLADIVQYIKDGDPLFFEAAARLRRHCEALVGYQTPRGLWRQSIACELAWEESSGSALIAYALGVGLRRGALARETFFPVFEKAIAGLAQHCVGGDFSTDYCCEGCLCPGKDADKGTLKAYLTDAHPRKDESHSYGAFMLAFLEAHRNGVRALAWEKGR